MTKLTVTFCNFVISPNKILDVLKPTLNDSTVKWSSNQTSRLHAPENADYLTFTSFANIFLWDCGEPYIHHYVYKNKLLSTVYRLIFRPERY